MYYNNTRPTTTTKDTNEVCHLQDISKVHGDDAVHDLSLAIALGVKCRAHVQLDASQTEELLLECTREHGVTIRGDGTQNAMKPHDAIEERSRHESRRVWMTHWDEMGILGETVDDREHHRLAANLGERLNEIHGDISPYLRRHGQGLK